MTGQGKGNRITTNDMTRTFTNGITYIRDSVSTRDKSGVMIYYWRPLSQLTLF
jgi:hypothetical protein